MRSLLGWAALAIAVGSLGCGDESDTTPASQAAAASGAGATGSGGTGSGATGGGGAGGEPCVVDMTYDPKIDPADFVDGVTNPLYPLVPGTEFTYENGDETIVVTVTSDKKTILGVSCVVVHDKATVLGEVIEDTFDWFAQDKDGAVWYMGEDTKEFRGGKVVSTHGSWTGGVDGAKPGIVIPADPKVGDKYRQEYHACDAEDYGEILALDAEAMVKQGMYTGCMKTRDTTPLEPDVNEEKYYCPGVGLVLSVDVKTGEREELVTVTP